MSLDLAFLEDNVFARDRIVLAELKLVGRLDAARVLLFNVKKARAFGANEFNELGC